MKTHSQMKLVEQAKRIAALETEAERLRAKVDFFERTMVPEEDLRVMTDARDMWRRAAEEKQVKAVEQGREVERLREAVNAEMKASLAHQTEVKRLQEELNEALAQVEYDQETGAELVSEVERLRAAPGTDRADSAEDVGDAAT